MKNVTFYRLDTKAIVGHATMPESMIPMNTPEGCGVWDGIIKPAPVALSAEHLAEVARRKRDYLLRATDWQVLVSAESGKPIKQSVARYRQALRDVPAQAGFPAFIDWPTLGN